MVAGSEVRFRSVPFRSVPFRSVRFIHSALSNLKLYQTSPPRENAAWWQINLAE
jgi:hypothetical protein